jgi:hypothetical protein
MWLLVIVASVGEKDKSGSPRSVPENMHAMRQSS